MIFALLSVTVPYYTLLLISLKKTFENITQLCLKDKINGVVIICLAFFSVDMSQSRHFVCHVICMVAVISVL